MKQLLVYKILQKYTRDKENNRPVGHVCVHGDS